MLKISQLPLLFLEVRDTKYIWQFSRKWIISSWYSFASYEPLCLFFIPWKAVQNKSIEYIYKRFSTMALRVLLHNLFQIVIFCTLKCNSSSGRFCESRFPRIQVSSDLRLHHDYFNPLIVGIKERVSFYTPISAAKGFVVNCSSTLPVFWDINLNLVKLIINKYFQMLYIVLFNSGVRELDCTLLFRQTDRKQHRHDIYGHN